MSVEFVSPFNSLHFFFVYYKGLLYSPHTVMIIRAFVYFYSLLVISFHGVFFNPFAFNLSSYLKYLSGE